MKMFMNFKKKNAQNLIVPPYIIEAWFGGGGLENSNLLDLRGKFTENSPASAHPQQTQLSFGPPFFRKEKKTKSTHKMQSTWFKIIPNLTLFNII